MKLTAQTSIDLRYVDRDELKEVVKRELSQQMTKLIMENFGDLIEMNISYYNPMNGGDTAEARFELDVEQYRGYHTGGFVVNSEIIDGQRITIIEDDESEFIEI